MSTAEVVTPDTDEVLEEEIVSVSPSRRALEVAAFITGLASLVMFAYYTLFLFTLVKLQKDQGQSAPTANQILQYLGTLLTQNYIAVTLALISITLVAVTRAIFADQRAHDRTVASATLAMVSGFVSLVFFVYNAISILKTGDSQLGTSAQAKFTVMMSHLIGTILAIGVLAIGIIFITARDDNDDLEEDLLAEDEAAAIEESEVETASVPEGEVKP